MLIFFFQIKAKNRLKFIEFIKKRNIDIEIKKLQKHAANYVLYCPIKSHWQYSLYKMLVFRHLEIIL